MQHLTLARAAVQTVTELNCLSFLSHPKNIFYTEYHAMQYNFKTDRFVCITRIIYSVCSYCEPPKYFQGHFHSVLHYRKHKL